MEDSKQEVIAALLNNSDVSEFNMHMESAKLHRDQAFDFCNQHSFMEATNEFTKARNFLERAMKNLNRARSYHQVREKN